MPLSISFSPPIAHLDGDAGVARLAESHKVARFIAAAFGERKDMVYLLGGCQFALLLTFLAQRVRLDVAVAGTLPCTAIPFIGCRVAFVLVVAFVHNLLMLGAVLPAIFGKPTAAGVSAWALGFVWHLFTPSWA